MKKECHDIIVKCDDCKATLPCRLEIQNGLVVYIKRQCRCAAKGKELFPDMPKVSKQVVSMQNRDQDLSDVYDTFRALFAPKALDSTFWGENKIAKAYRQDAAEAVKAFGKDVICWSICGHKDNAHWVSEGRSFGLSNALRKMNIEIGKSYWDRMTVQRRQRLIDVANEYMENKRCR